MCKDGDISAAGVSLPAQAWKPLTPQTVVPLCLELRYSECERASAAMLLCSPGSTFRCVHMHERSWFMSFRESLRDLRGCLETVPGWFWSRAACKSRGVAQTCAAAAAGFPQPRSSVTRKALCGVGDFRPVRWCQTASPTGWLMVPQVTHLYSHKPPDTIGQHTRSVSAAPPTT